VKNDPVNLVDPSGLSWGPNAAPASAAAIGLGGLGVDGLKAGIVCAAMDNNTSKMFRSIGALGWDLINQSIIYIIVDKDCHGKCTYSMQEYAIPGGITDQYNHTPARYGGRGMSTPGA